LVCIDMYVMQVVERGCTIPVCSIAAWVH